MKRYNEFINEQVDWNLKLIKYVINDDLEGVKLALDNGANIHYLDDHALWHGSYRGHLDIVKYLLNNGANIHFLNDAALKMAISEDHLKVVEYICEYIIKNEPWYIPKIIQYIPDELKEKYPHLMAGADMDLL